MIDKSRILSDRYVIKEYDLKLKDKRVALIDDTMMTGYALYRVFSKLRQWYPEMQIETMVVYCGTQKIEPQQISRNPKAERALIDEFVSSIQYVTEASYETLGLFLFIWHDLYSTLWFRMWWSFLFSKQRICSR